VLPRPPF